MSRFSRRLGLETVENVPVRLRKVENLGYDMKKRAKKKYILGKFPEKRCWRRKMKCL
jgi:hypothetical protein